jgi:uncharacterized protein
LKDNIIDIRIDAKNIQHDSEIRKAISDHLHISKKEIFFYHILKQSLDARSPNIKYNLRIQVSTQPISQKSFYTTYQVGDQTKPVHIIGAGPAGLFAALKCIELGYKPIVIERGKDVRARRRDLAAINKAHIVNAESNYCFGEGGAGTYSDGKLYTRSSKRGSVEEVLETLVKHGANENILVEAHPHIGTNKLPDIIQNIRETIIQYGGEIRFNTKLVDLHLEKNKIRTIVLEYLETNERKNEEVRQVILATGHSARDIYELLHDKNISIEAKPFAMGVRVEHPQSLIDSKQYHCRSEKDLEEKRQYLPAAAYSLVQQVEGRGVFSFCMCPGGIIAPCATGPEQVVTNGWSPSKRNNPYANSGIVVSIEIEDLKAYHSHGPLAGLAFQKDLEKLAYEHGGKSQIAPAQRVLDFTNNKTSSSLPPCSYTPGVVSSPMHEWLPEHIRKRLQVGFKAFGQKIKGYLSNDAIIVGVESRTSTPVRIPRDSDSLSHPQISNLYPCGEGAGYAGGIVSAAMDGMNVINALHNK